MKPQERSLGYLEHAITIAAFGTEEARDAFLSAHAGEDLVEIAMRHIAPDLRGDYVTAAQPLTECGIPEVEARAKQIIAFAGLPASAGPQTADAPEWPDLRRQVSGNRNG
jgi:hypothetical protein